MVEHQRPALDERTTRHPGYATVALFRKTRFKGVQRTDFASRLVGAAYNLRRMVNLLPLTA